MDPNETVSMLEDGLPGHAVDAFDRASRLLELP